MSQVDATSALPPPLPARKGTAQLPASPSPLIESQGDVPSTSTSAAAAVQPAPPPLPARTPRQVPAVALAPPLEVLPETTATPIPLQPSQAAPVLRPISVEVTPATPQLLSPVTPPTPLSPIVPGSIPKDPPTTSIPITDPHPQPLPAFPLPDPPHTAPPSFPSTVSSGPPPLPARPSHPSPAAQIPLPSVSADSLPPMTSWVAATLAVAILAYTRVLPLWLLLIGVGAGGYMWQSAPVTVEEDEDTRRVLGKDREQMKHAVGWVNHLLYALFPLISTDVLVPFIDLLEDALIQQIPPIVTSVRLEAPALGSQPLLLTSLRSMTDEEWFASVAQPSSSSRSTVSESKDSAERTGHRKSLSARNLGEAVKGHKRGKSESSAVGGTGMSRSVSGSSMADTPDLAMGNVEVEKRRRRDRVLRRVKKVSDDHLRDHSSSSAAANGGGALLSPDGPSLPNTPPSDLANGPDSPPAEEDPEESGQYVNFQVGFEYKRPDSTKNRKGYGLHVLGYFGIGIKGLGRTEIPVYIDMLGIKGTINVRILLSATPPFARTATVSFTRLPEFDISAKPLTRSTFNAMSLPGMKPYVQSSIAAVAKTFVRPLSYTLDVDRLLLGREAAFRTASIGVLHVIIHSAEGLPKVDTMGTCDPYVAVGFAKYHKPVFSTRTIIGNQNPSWEEPAFVLVTSDEIESGESLRLRVCDADRFSADDALGIVEVELADLLEHASSSPGSDPVRRTDALKADKPGMRVSGSVTWSVRFAPLWQMTPEELHKRLTKVKADGRKGDCHEVAPWWFDWVERFLGERPQWAGEREERRKETIQWFTGEKEKDEMEIMERPTDEYRSGVLQFHIHQCTDLEVERLEGTYSANSSSRKSAAGGRPALGDVIDRTSAENPEPPSSYVEVHLNDRMVFRTRTKQVTPMPYFNAVSERFLRDWRMAKLVFVVRDERDREHDPILGIVTLRLGEAFKEGSQFTRWYPLVGGLGWGRLRISLLWKPIDIHLPPRVSAFEVATLEIKSVSATDLSHLADKKGISLLLETEADKFVLSSDTSDNIHSARTSISRSPSISTPFTSTFPPSPGISTTTSNAETEMEWDITRPIRLAVEYRHSCSVLLSFITRQGVMRKKRVVGLASIRLNDVEDHESVTRTIPIFDTSSVKDAIIAGQAYTEVHNSAGRDGVPLTRLLTRDVPILGFVSIGFALRPGVSKAHKKLAKKDMRFMKVYEAWETDRDVRHGMEGVDTGTGKREDGDEEEISDGESDSEDDDPPAVGGVGGKVRRTPSGKSLGAASARSGFSGMSVPQEDGDESDEGFMSKRRAHSKALHKRHKGIFQLKVARTGKFVKDMVEAKLYARATDRRIRGADLDVEQEGQSKL